MKPMKMPFAPFDLMSPIHIYAFGSFLKDLCLRYFFAIKAMAGIPHQRHYKAELGGQST